VRRLGSQEQQVMPLDAAIRALSAEAVPPDLRESAESKAA
jgi:threonyl-tRNA synthetase